MSDPRGALLDERSRPDLRERFGRLAASSSEISVAVRRVRLVGVDLTEQEVRNVGRLRVLLTELRADVFSSEADWVMVDPERRPFAERLLALIQRQVVSVRVAPLAWWAPDFSVFHDGSGPRAALFGFHWFQRPFPHAGPAFASEYGRDEARMGASRFDELWAVGHDATDAVEHLLAGARKRARSGSDQPSGRD